MPTAARRRPQNPFRAKPVEGKELVRATREAVAEMGKTGHEPQKANWQESDPAQASRVAWEKFKIVYGREPEKAHEFERFEEEIERKIPVLRQQGVPEEQIRAMIRAALIKLHSRVLPKVPVNEERINRLMRSFESMGVLEREGHH